MHTRKGGDMGRFSVEFEARNYGDVVAAKLGVLEPEKVRRVLVQGWSIPGPATWCCRRAS